MNQEIQDVQNLHKRFKKADFKERREIITKYIEKVEVLYGENIYPKVDKGYALTIHYKLPNLTPTTFYVDWRYKMAYTETAHDYFDMFPTEEESKRMNDAFITGDYNYKPNPDNFIKGEPEKVTYIDFELMPFIEDYRKESK
jgi:hypothetical protein